MFNKEEKAENSQKTTQNDFADLIFGLIWAVFPCSFTLRGIHDILYSLILVLPTYLT